MCQLLLRLQNHCKYRRLHLIFIDAIITGLLPISTLANKFTRKLSGEGVRSTLTMLRDCEMVEIQSEPTSRMDSAAFNFQIWVWCYSVHRLLHERKCSAQNSLNRMFNLPLQYLKWN